MSKHNYNILALRGLDVSDEEHAADLGIPVPAEVLNTPKYNDWVLDYMYNKNIEDLQAVNNPLTGMPYTQKEATEEATALRNQAAMNIKKLMK